MWPMHTHRMLAGRCRSPRAPSNTLGSPWFFERDHRTRMNVNARNMNTIKHLTQGIAYRGESWVAARQDATCAALESATPPMEGRHAVGARRTTKERGSMGLASHRDIGNPCSHTHTHLARDGKRSLLSTSKSQDRIHAHATYPPQRLHPGRWLPMSLQRTKPVK